MSRGVAHRRLWCFTVEFSLPVFYLFFFFNDTATTEIYTLSLHDALPISLRMGPPASRDSRGAPAAGSSRRRGPGDRKSTRLNSSHLVISYAVFCLKKKKKHHNRNTLPKHAHQRCRQQTLASVALARTS